MNKLLNMPQVVGKDGSYIDNKGNTKFITKDSGKRQEFSTGMKRDTQDNKPRYDLLSGVTQKDTLLKRWAELMARGAVKYDARNWEKACTEEELERFKASAWRHFVSAMQGEVDEDHIAAVCFNLNGMLYVMEKLNEENVRQNVKTSNK